MRQQSLAALVFASGAIAGTTRFRRQSDGDKPDAAIPDGQTEDCTHWYTPAKGQDCEWIEGNWLVPHEDFVEWNPSVKDDCSGIEQGYSYCVEVDTEDDLPTTTPIVTPTPTPTPTPTGSPVPSPTPDGTAKDCDSFHHVKKGDVCDKLCAKYGISMKQFMKWNPQVDEECNGLWADFYYCMSVEGVEPSPTTGNPDPEPTGDAPGPTQTGIVKDCEDWHLAKKGEDCQKIVDQYGNLDLKKFQKWNPAVGDKCSGLWAKYAYCVGTKDDPAKPPANPPPAECEVPHPEPTQPGAICKCKKWHKIVKGDTCYTLGKKYNISEDDIKKWNPGTDCNMWKDYNVCVGA